jgi:uncharacterized protein YueI
LTKENTFCSRYLNGSVDEASTCHIPRCAHLQKGTKGSKRTHSFETRDALGTLDTRDTLNTLDTLETRDTGNGERSDLMKEETVNSSETKP